MYDAYCPSCGQLNKLAEAYLGIEVECHVCRAEFVFGKEAIAERRRIEKGEQFDVEPLVDLIQQAPPTVPPAIAPPVQTLIPCPDCGSTISVNAFACPHCGMSRSPQVIEKTSKQWKGIQLVGALVLFGCGLASLVLSPILPLLAALFLLASVAGGVTLIVGRFAAWWHHG